MRPPPRAARAPPRIFGKRKSKGASPFFFLQISWGGRASALARGGLAPLCTQGYSAARRLTTTVTSGFLPISSIATWRAILVMDSDSLSSSASNLRPAASR